MREFPASGVLQFRKVAPRGRRHKLLAVSSGGGHWIQLLRVSAAFDNCEVTFVTTHDSYRSQVKDCRFWTVNDSNLSSKLGLVKTAAQLTRIILDEMPDVVISTGAAPGYSGVAMVKFTIPNNFPTGTSVPVTVTINGVTSNTVMLPLL